MSQNRSLLFHGLGLTLRRFPALLWAFVFNLVYAAFATSRIAMDIGHVTDTSLAAAPLSHGFDLSTLAGLLGKLSVGPGLSPSVAPSLPLYLATYFLLVPGTLLCYQTGASARLSTLLQAGLLHFWRFVRITLLAVIVSGLVLGPLVALQMRWADHVDAHVVGLSAFLHDLAGILVIALVAAVLRLYFDLVEVYTVQLGLQTRPNGKPDRRVRKTLLPALRALRKNFWRAYITFVSLAVLGLAAIFFTARVAMHSLGQPRVWPMFLLAQMGLFLMLATRFWQRGAETTLSLDFPIVEAEAPYSGPSFVTRSPLMVPPEPDAILHHARVTDPIPAPEPASPSLAEPDPGVYHPEVPPQTPPEDVS